METTMVGLKVKDINKDVLMLFSMCYEYSLNFTNVLKLFGISDKYFWTFMEICSPMIKVGIRKATNIRKSVDKILPHAKKLSVTGADLNPREDKILQAFTWYVQDSFSDGEGCLHISQVQSMPFAKGYDENGNLIAVTPKSIRANLDEIAFITLGEAKFYKTSRMLYYLEKYCGNITLNELNNLSVPEMLSRIADGEYNSATA